MLNLDKLRVRILNKTIPIGGILQLENHLVGSVEPPIENFIRLRAGLTGAGLYNEGKLISETTTGSFPLVISTAVIDDIDSPLDGELISLVETEERFFRAGGTIGGLENDAIQIHSHSFINQSNQGGSNAPAGGGGVGSIPASTDSNSGRSSSETRVKNQRVAVYLRYK